MRKINLISPILFLTAISLSSTLASPTMARNALFLAFSLSIIDLVLKRTITLNKKYIAATLAIFAVGITQYLFATLQNQTDSLSVNKDYTATSQRILMAGVVFYYLTSHLNKISERTAMIAKGLVITGFLYTSFVALRIHYISPDSRLDINTVSTISAYSYSILSLCAIHIISRNESQIRILTLSIFLLFSYYIIMLTQTRAVMMSYPFFAIALLYKQNFFNLRSTLILVFFIITGSAFNYKIIQTGVDRLNYALNDIQVYDNNNSTSLGSRVSMWRAGTAAFLQHPFGQSVKSRYDFSKDYIDQNEGSNPEAIANMKFHFHNEFIETASLRGVTGIIVLLLFYVSITITTYRMTDSGVIAFIIILPAFIYGLTDTLFIDKHLVTMFFPLIIFNICCYKKRESTPLQ